MLKCGSPDYHLQTPKLGVSVRHFTLRLSYLVKVTPSPFL